MKISKEKIEELRELMSLDCEYSGTKDVVSDTVADILRGLGSELDSADEIELSDGDVEFCTLDDFVRAFWERSVELFLNVLGPGDFDLCMMMMGKYADKQYADMVEIRKTLLESFSDSFINEYDEFIAHARANDYFTLKDCEYPIDLKCKVLEYLSRATVKGQPYAQEWRNKKYRKLMQDEINTFFGTNFSEKQFAAIYQKLGNAVRHELTKEFIESDFNFSLLG